VHVRPDLLVAVAVARLEVHAVQREGDDGTSDADDGRLLPQRRGRCAGTSGTAGVVVSATARGE
jgi:hypothetical protein